MTKEERKQLEMQLSILDRNEKNKLYKRAAQMRKLAQKKQGARPRRAYVHLDDDDEAADIGSRQPDSTLYDYVLKLLGEELRETHEREAKLPIGTVVAIGPGSAEVVIDGKPLAAALAKDLAERQQSEIAVGDLVEVDRRTDGSAIIQAVRPRRTKLSRPDPGAANRERVIVANVDVVVIVVSVVSPPLHPRLIDRYLIAIARGGAQPAICVNKTDLLDPDALLQELEVLRPYRALRLPIATCSATESKGTDALREVIAGQVSAFVGHSGVGKSSLLNSLKPDLALEVGAVSAGNRRGAHTTTRSTMWDLGGGTRIIDTPGVRSFGLWNLKAADLPWYFPELISAGGCKFRNCSHTHEPECAVKEAVASGKISRDRYDTYLRILFSL